MSYEKPKIRYAHEKGRTGVCFSEDGECFVTYGADGDVRILKGFDDDDPVSRKLGKFVRSVLCKNGSLYAITESLSVDVHTFPDHEPDGIVTRFSSEPTHMAFNTSGTKLAVGSADFIIKFVNVDSNFPQTFEGHEAPVLSVAVDPKGHYLASSSCDGTVKIWKVSEQRCIETLGDVVPRSNDYSHSKRLCRLAWDREGKSLFIPMDNGVKVLSRSTWEDEQVLFGKTNKEFDVVGVSSCGTLIAAGTMDGCVYVQRLGSGARGDHVCLHHDRPNPITCIAWHPSHTDLAYCDDRGQLGLFENVSVDRGMSANQQLSADQAAALFDSDDDDIMGDINPPVDGPMGVSQTEDMPQDEDDEDAVPRLKRRLKALQDPDENSIGDSNLDSLINELTEEATKEDTTGMSRVRGQPTSNVKVTPLQTPFQSSSTPGGLQSRFMVWNNVGLIKQLCNDEEESINIEFHDTSVHHSIHLNNADGYSMADMSEEAVLLASGDEDEPSKICCHHLTSWDAVKEWSVHLPKGETSRCVTVGKGWCAVATSARLIRWYTSAGMQRAALSIAGDPVTMAAYGTLLFVVYHRGTGTPGDQCLSYSLLQMTGLGRVIIDSASLPLSPQSTLSWAGFSTQGSPFIYDSAGRLRMLGSYQSKLWVQVANMKDQAKHNSDHYWLVGISEKPAQIRCVHCRGSRFPPTLPQPSLMIQGFKLPFCDLSTERGKLEESLARSQVIHTGFDWEEMDFSFESATARERRMKEEQVALLKLFALACKSDRECRAVELAGLMPTQQAVRLAIKYATNDNRPELASRLNEVARGKAGETSRPTDGTPYGKGAGTGRESTPASAELRTPVLRRSISSGLSQSQGMSVSLEDSSYGSLDQPAHRADTASPVTTTPASSGQRLLLRKSESTKHAFKSISGDSQKASSNPFKKTPANTPSPSLPARATPPLKRGSSVFDDMSQPHPNTKLAAKKPATGRSTENKSARKDQKSTTKGQMKLFAPKSAGSASKPDREDVPSPEPTKPVSAFDLWFEASQSELETGDDSSSKENAMTLFSKLPIDEKKQWISKAQSQSLNASDDKNEKLQDTAEASEGAAPRTSHHKTSDSAKNKLASFAFQS